ncbi:hypothetical protein [Caulobacter sp. RHG1]|uniref:hypothetical protein n=1 Tax=Caulobacter sp. (strain RHG1) TaxID=2545762 RepID=UPI0015562F7F|nr:hypothetical protein [Caulobacter sp. RHG1]NQE63812.1 hypothetical protein [Caulobacter sp. RHG1]
MLIFNRLHDERRESPTLVVLTTSLQLALVVLVWLLALIPAALAALTVLTIKTVRAAFRKVSVAKPPVGGDKA